MTDQTTYELTIRAEGPDERPAIVRLRALLKLMLRGFGLRCLTVREVPRDDAEKSIGSSGAEITQTLTRNG